MLVRAEAARPGIAIATKEIVFLGSLASAILPKLVRGLPKEAQTRGMAFCSRNIVIMVRPRNPRE